MIIPRISLDDITEDGSGARSEAAVQLARRWSLFGRLCIQSNTDDFDTVKHVIRKLGDTDITVWIDGIAPPMALELLNHGAAKMIVPNPDDFGDVAPAERFESADSIDAMFDVDRLEQEPEMLVDIIMERVKSDRPDGLIPTIIADPIGTALGLAYSNRASIAHALATRNGTYWSRSRNSLWEKGATSGATQKLMRIDADCDRDCLRFTVDQQPPGFCHEQTYTCFGQQRSIQTVIHRLEERIKGSDTKSFTYKLANDAKMLEAKLLEEAQELSDADVKDEITWEAADVLYFSLVKMVNNGVSLDRVFAELARRMNRVVRRKNKLEKDSE